MNMQTANFDAANESSSLGLLLPHLPTVVRQSKWLVVVPTLIGLIIGVTAAFLLPVTYQSKATLLVEAPLLSDDIATEASGAEIIDQRMARIRQEILSRSRLIDLINRNSLYTNEARIKSLSEIIDQMREAIVIEPVTANIQTTNRGQRSTIAFSISFDYADPAKAQAVLQALTQQIQEINSTTRSQQAASTVQFLTDQADELQTQMSQLQGQILSIKARNGIALAGPSLLGGSSPDSIQSQIISLEQTNATLRQQRQLVNTESDRDPTVQQAEAALAALRATYTENHPDVQLAKQRLEEAKRLAKTRVAQLPVDRGSSIDDQIALNNRHIATLRGSMGAAAASMAASRQAPVVQEELAQLQSKLDGYNAQYQRVANQLSSARAGKRADDEQQGEQLRMVESPSVPDAPISPNRPLLIGGGLTAGLGFGLFLVLVLEMIRRPVRHIGSVTSIIGEPPLVVIPTIYSPGEKKGGLLSRLWSGGKNGEDDDE